MASASDLVTTIISDLNRADTSLSDIVMIDVLSSIRDYEAYRFFFNETTLALTLTATDTYALSLFAAAGSGVSDVIEVDGLDVTAGGRTYELDERGARYVLDLQGLGQTGNPSYFATFNQSILINSTPNLVLTGTLTAHVKFADTSISSSNAWTNVASELIRNATLKRLWGRKFRGADGAMEAAQAAAVGEQAALAALQRRTDALSGSSMEPYI